MKPRSGMSVFGLTGGIGSGKTEVGRVMAMVGIPVIDADRVAREQAASTGPAFQHIVGEFGPGILGHDGEIDRDALAGLVFGDPSRLAALNRITHGLVMEEVGRRLGLLEGIGACIAIVEAALLIETGADASMDGVVVVMAPRSARIGRVVARDRASESDVVKRMDAQMDPELKAGRARWVIENNDGLDELRRASIDVAIAMTLEGRR